MVEVVDAAAQLLDGVQGGGDLLADRIVRRHGAEEGVRLVGDLVGDLHLHHVQVLAQLLLQLLPRRQHLPAA